MKNILPFVLLFLGLNTYSQNRKKISVCQQKMEPYIA
jgi:hypothetical protein